MSELLLQPVPGSPSAYEVILAEGQTIGRINLFGFLGRHSMWAIDFAFHEGRDLTHGFETTREAAMQAFAWCGFRDQR